MPLQPFTKNVLVKAFKPTGRSLSFSSTRLMSSQPPEQPKKLKYADVRQISFTKSPQKNVGINLTDSTFRGIYHNKPAHPDDLAHVLQRAVSAGCAKLMVTGSSLTESQKAIDLATKYPGLCYATVGVHPCSAKSFDEYAEGPDALLTTLTELALEAKERKWATAYGEIGLDYDRLFLTPKEQQVKYFEAQLDVAVKVQLPLFLHSRAASEDFERLLSAKLPLLPKKGLVHSFTGTREEMERLVALGLDIGVNGCSMKSEENLEVVRAVPLERLQIETDGPWHGVWGRLMGNEKCDMRASHASAKYKDDAPQLPKSVKKEKWTKDCIIKGRNEPVTISHVAHVIAKVKGISIEELCEAAWKNSIEMFGFEEAEQQEAPDSTI
ncbi:hypothetical protein ACLMJK_007068 [Lecanora helva]